MFLQTSLYFLKPNKLFKVEKSYAFEISVEGGTIRKSNMRNIVGEGITLTNMRGYEKAFTMKTNGFAVLTLNTGLEYKDFYQKAELSLYLRKIESLLKEHIDASRAEVFRHCVRMFSFSSVLHAQIHTYSDFRWCLDTKTPSSISNIHGEEIRLWPADHRGVL